MLRPVASGIGVAAATAAVAFTTFLVRGPSAGLIAAADAGNWPQWRGPARDGLSTETGLLQQWDADGPPLAWQSSGLGAGFSSVAVAGNRIYTMGDLAQEQFVLALDGASGTVLWKARVGPAWDDRYPGPRGTPTIDGELLYAVGTDGDLVCLETATGKERWRTNLERDLGGRSMSSWRFAESPLVDGDRVIVTPGTRSAALAALDKRTGRPIWRASIPELGANGRDGAGYSSVVVSTGGGVKQYVQLLGRGLVGIRAEDGTFLWGYNRVANDVANISTPIVRGDHVFASTAYQTGSVLLRLSADGPGRVRASEVYWLDSRTFQNHHGGFVLVGSHVFGGHGHRLGFPICLEFESGKVVWGGDIRNEGTGSAAVAFADGHLYFRYENGVMMLIEATPAGYRQKGHFRLPTTNYPSWPHPVVTGGKLYLREQDRLFVYDLRRPGDKGSRE